MSMANISIIIAAYNTSAFISDCLISIINQTYKDIEIIVVDDGSLDETPHILRNYANQDHRIKVITHLHNKGLLAARKTGISAASSPWSMFIDSDDSLEPTTCEHLINELEQSPVDILHFGAKVIPSSAEAQEAAAAYESFMNPYPCSLTNSEILFRAFTDNPLRYHWQMVEKLFSTALLKKCYSVIPDIYLTQSEDACTYFIVASQATTYRSIPNSSWYHYCLGRGVSLSSRPSEDKFISNNLQHSKALKIARDGALELCSSIPKRQIIMEAYQGFEHLLAQYTFNEWKDSFDRSSRESLFPVLKQTFSDEGIAPELYRFTRDAAYSALTKLRSNPQKSIDDDLEELELLEDLLSGLNDIDNINSNKIIASMRDLIESHLLDCIKILSSSNREIPEVMVSERFVTINHKEEASQTNTLVNRLLKWILRK